ncbi:MAG: antibiotic biosynthesis monooxygenase family protein [Shimia sp.]|uniref:antibiotic biosynthesis monooxygenase family protein n=1 Tax=Shimia sp. TaxID=1954381 RepID=UPI004058E5A4
MSVLEIVRYRVKDGVTPEAALAAWEKSQPFANAQPGFVSRKLAHTSEGIFADIVEWETMEAALAVMEEFKVDKHPELADLVAVLDDDSVEIQHFTVSGREG